jgi:hypothetical protein
MNKNYVRIIQKMSLIMAALSFVGCASYFKRKDCEKTNWFSHGEKVALDGGTLEGDVFLSECRQAEAQINESALDQGYKNGRADYCKPETVYITGKKGDKFKSAMCDGEPMKLLMAKYKTGLTEFCRPSNGFNAGKTGRKYNNVCPADIEKDFLPQFNQGRKSYLNSLIDTKEAEIKDIERSIYDLEFRKRELLIRLAATPRTNIIVNKKSKKGELQIQETDASASARQQIESDMNNVDWQIRQKRSEQDKIRTEIRSIQSEIATL